MKKEVTEVIKRIHEIEITGDVIPPSWYSHIIYTTKKGKVKPDMLAIAILANIVYWYKPRIIRDEQTNRVTGYERKFDLDKLQRSYAQLGKFYGQTKDEIKTAVRRLEELKLITVEFRTLKMNGKVYNNVMFVEPIAETIKKINEITPYAKNSWEGYGKNLAQAPLKKSDTPLLNFPGTNTETSYTEISTKTSKEKEEISFLNLKDKFSEYLKSKGIDYNYGSNKEYFAIQRFQDSKNTPQSVLDLVDKLIEVKKHYSKDNFYLSICFNLSDLSSYQAKIVNAYSLIPSKQKQNEVSQKEPAISIEDFLSKLNAVPKRKEEFRQLHPTMSNTVLLVSSEPSEVMKKFIEGYFKTYQVRKLAV